MADAGSRPMVLYHANCPDGWCSAWVVHGKFGDGADYIPVQYGQAPPAMEDGATVFIVDFSYDRETLIALARRSNSVVVLDHHKTAKEALTGLDLARPGLSIVFDMTKSGCRLAWEHFHPGEPSPWLVDYTEDRDLWRWALPSSREVNSGLAGYPRDFATWDELSRDPGAFSVVATEGAAIERYKDQLVRSICAGAREETIDGHRILAANTSVLISEVAGELAAGRPFGAAWFIRGDGARQWSLRSREGGVDVSEVARRHGGGGHRNAAGFQEST